MSLPTEALDYELPSHLIARHPATERDGSRLLVLHRSTGDVEHGRFTDLPRFLQADDLMVVNTTRVRRARLVGRRASGGRVEILLVRPAEHDRWLCMLKPASRLRPGERIDLEQGYHARIESVERRGMGTITLPGTAAVDSLLEQIGHVPLPPYIDRPDEPEDVNRYQTVYAREPGAVAAPTAGLHFTPRLLDRLTEQRVRQAEVVLHVGPGTFRPIESDHVEHHELDAEWYHFPAETRRRIAQTRTGRGRVLAVGTTSVRALETVARLPQATLEDVEGWTRLMICPPFEFRWTDLILTNFHLPRSSLLALVAAFAGLERIREAYSVAVERGYRFYSYGDAMLIL